MTTETIVVAGSLAQRSGHGGHTSVFLQYLMGFRRLGFDVVFVDRLEPDMCAHPESSVNVHYLDDVMTRAGFGGDWALLYDGGSRVLGMTGSELERRIDRAQLLLNVMGYVEDERVLGSVPLKVFLDIDPGFPQMWQDLGLHAACVGHDAYVTIGENIGSPDCTIPTLGIDWITTKQPVALEAWPVVHGRGQNFTSVGAWRGPFGPIEHGGRTYGLRVHEFRRFLALPRRVDESFEVAVDIHEADQDDIDRLRQNGWRLRDPSDVASDPWTYQRFVQGSLAEVMIAKNLYVASRGGWFSDRSACYLASGRPVLAQDTGLGGLLPTGSGLLMFDDPDEAVAGATEIIGDHDRHSRAARALAEEYFDSDRVLSRLLDRLGVETPAAPRP